MDDNFSLKKASFQWFCDFVLKHYCNLITNDIALPSSSKSFIVCSNHQSHLDTPVLIHALNKKLSDFKMLAAKDHFQGNKNKRSFSQSLLDLILVDRQASVIETRRLIQECHQAITDNKHLIIYPEGTRNTQSKILPFKQGAIYIALKLSLPIIPAAILGTEDALGKGDYFIRPKKIQVKFGEPYLPHLPQNKISKHTLQYQTDMLQTQIESLYQTLLS